MQLARRNLKRSLRNRVHARGAIVRSDCRRFCAESFGNCRPKHQPTHRSCTRWGIISKDPIGFAAGDANLYRYVENAPTTHTDPSGLSKGKVIGWVVRRVGGKLVKVSAVYTEKQAAQAFAGKCGKYGLDLLMREGRGSAEKVARIIQARLGKKATGEVLGGGSHLGHPIRNLLGQ